MVLVWLQRLVRIYSEAFPSSAEFSVRSLAAVVALKLPNNLFDMTPNSNIFGAASCLGPSVI